MFFVRRALTFISSLFPRTKTPHPSAALPKVDEFIPCHPRHWWDDQGTPLFARCNGNDAWVTGADGGLRWWRWRVFLVVLPFFLFNTYLNKIWPVFFNTYKSWALLKYTLYLFWGLFIFCCRLLKQILVSQKTKSKCFLSKKEHWGTKVAGKVKPA